MSTGGWELHLNGHPVYQCHCKSHINMSYLYLSFLSFAAIVSSTLTLAFPDALVDQVATTLFDLFGVDQDIRDFITKDYLTEVS